MIGAVSGLLFLALMALSWLAGSGGAGVRAAPGKSPDRIVSLAPSITEILFALGLDREVAGVTDYCDYPEAALAKPRVGGFKGKSLEAIVGLSPALVIGTGDGNEAGIIRAMERLGIPVLTIQPATLTGVIESIRVIGRATGRAARAERLARDLEDKLFDVHSRVKDAPRVRVLFVYGRDPLVLAGPGTFADDMIRWAGGENVVGQAIIPYPRFSMETVLASAPQVIVEGIMGTESAEDQVIAARAHWARWDSLPAVKNDRIVLIDEDLIARPGPRIFEGLEELARALHPERFPEEAGP